MKFKTFFIGLFLLCLTSSPAFGLIGIGTIESGNELIEVLVKSVNYLDTNKLPDIELDKFNVPLVLGYIVGIIHCYRTYDSVIKKIVPKDKCICYPSQ